MIFGAEGDFQKAFDDLAVGEYLLLGTLAVRDRRNSATAAGGTRVSLSAIAARAAVRVQR